MANKYKTVKFSRRVIYSLLLYNIVLALLIRYNTSIGIEKGTPDSWDYHILTNQLISQGKVLWFLNILSFFGLYPPYSEFGAELLLATNALIFNIPVTYSILITTNFFAIMSIFFIFIFIRKIFRDDCLALICSITFSCSPLVYKLSTWGVSKRMFACIMCIILVYVVFQFLRSREINKTVSLRYLSILIVLLAIVLSLHKSGMFALLLLIPALIAFNSSPIETTSAPDPIFFNSFSNVKFELDFTEKHIKGLTLSKVFVIF